ncbi:aldehyde dehydrogenase family protein [Thalassotalea ponticola]|uniref:aldehyde dehydrogenase family protein n=1 Tax=Thalassotalea ponticola TaxID=1523392 RepID=UPI0025B34415|nr:aldehyde dehydrogenase family protein [Thalassotalea ponticola]MDN3653844.1 aldehyde dehydrogenase family protein [Thalassotalea ponticola]
MNTYSHFYINGQWQLPVTNGNRIEVTNPANGKCIAITASASADDVDRAVASAKQAFASWSTTSAAQRRHFINAIADEMQQRAAELTAAISDSMGCPYNLTRKMQVQDSIDAFRQFADMTDYVEQTEAFPGGQHHRHAIGVCVLINPWNYPLSQLVGKLGPALATGCTVVVKPSEQTPLQDLIIAEICDKVGLPAGVFNLLTGYGSQIGTHLCSHPDVDMVSFTGSTAAGVSVAQAAAPSVKRVCQELGGKSALIITDDADLEQAVAFGVHDVMTNSGQTCSALTRMLVPISHYQQVLDIARDIANSYTVGDPRSEHTTMGPLSSTQQQQRVIDYIQRGIDEGARLIVGGVELPSELQHGAYVMPTIFADVSNDMTIAQEEIFGPVLCIIGYQSTQQAIEIANDSAYGLASAVYAANTADALNIGKQLRAGQCYLQGHYFNTYGAFGGFKQSGNGREWGVEGLREYIELQAIFCQTSDMDRPS